MLLAVIFVLHQIARHIKHRYTPTETDQNASNVQTCINRLTSSSLVDEFPPPRKRCAFWDTLQWEDTDGVVDGQAFTLLGVLTSGNPHAYSQKCMHGAKGEQGWLAPMMIPYHVVFVSVDLQGV